MRVLGIDTTTWSGSIAIVEDSYIKGEVGLRTEITHANKIMVAIDFLLNQFQKTMKDFEGIAVSTGPGSFTGIRIGIATAKGLAMASQKPLIGISTLHAMAESFITNGFLCPFIDAGRGEVYACCYKREGNLLWKMEEESIADPVEFLKNIKGKPLHIFGTGADRYKEKIESINRGRYLFWPFNHYIAPYVARLGGHRLQENRVPLFKPNYIRKSDAELHKGQREESQ